MQQMEFGEQSCNPLSLRRSAGVLGGSPKSERHETQPRNAERSNHIPNHKGAEENRRRAMSPLCDIGGRPARPTFELHVSRNWERKSRQHVLYMDCWTVFSCWKCARPLPRKCYETFQIIIKNTKTKHDSMKN